MDIFDEVADCFHPDVFETETQNADLGMKTKCETDSGNEVLPLRKRQKKWNFIPRVIKSDIRRHYGTLIANVINSNSEQIVRSFFLEFARPSFRVHFCPINPSSYSHLPQQAFQKFSSRLCKGMSLDGLEWFRFHGLLYQVLSPDHVFRLVDARLVTRARDRRSIVVMSTEVEMTRIFDVDPFQWFDAIFAFEEDNLLDSEDKNMLYANSKPYNSFDAVYRSHDSKPRGQLKVPFPIGSHYVAPNASRSGSEMEAVIVDSFGQQVGHSLKMLSKPRHFRVKSQLVLVIDAEKRIESMTMAYDNLPPDLLECLERNAAVLTLTKQHFFCSYFSSCVCVFKSGDFTLFVISFLLELRHFDIENFFAFSIPLLLSARLIY